ncbi:PBP1A family penicillin-binding protein [Paenibacillus sp. SYP-B3998]|uniref:PBP1A family penicillin-binding protein n=1 Tax=Paenibacillus sp. SYP-B3998 TaxID=2678564 RepID=A0A6G4A189_9BACL|nr:PBP1A family penicillin-binding protein [Paenibacillus sp. SYP-B3998]NEW07589.1 PBP1A family penicillin-binding protein [Paenibacillus sp. SYP-B3998]
MSDNKRPTPASSPSSQKDKEVASMRWMRRIKKMFSFLFSSFVILLIVTAAGLIYLRSQTLPVTKMLQTSQMYDAHGQLIDTFYSGQNRQVVALKDISPYLIKATLSVEDQHFYDHFGVDVKAVARAAVVNVQAMAKVQGAGTITQQLARNLYLNHDRTWSRKIKETVFAIQMEMQLSKDEILTNYLNQIYYGHSTYGIETASELFFGKHASELTLAESAMVAGVPKGPRYYSPYYDLTNAMDRQKIVLQTMVRSGFITQSAADAAARERLVIQPLTKKKPASAPYFRDYIRTLATDRLGIPEEQLDEGGIKIFTTLDMNAQKIAEDIITKQLAGKPDIQAALVAIDPRTGAIKAMVGGRDYSDTQFNRALSNTRQPGSSFKPFVYMVALQNGYTPATLVKSEPTVFTYDEGRQTYTPRNFNDQYVNTNIDMRQAISKSDNIYAVHTILDVGPAKVIELARKLGIASSMKPLPSLALGSFPVSPMEMASAFGTIANQGVHNETTAIERIEDANGKILYEAKPKSEKVLDPAIAYVMTNLMESVFEEGGTGNRVANTIKRPIAGKTGTTDTDAWLVGFTPELATAVWVGYDKDRDISSVESHMASPIFAEFTEQTLEAIPPKLFPIPEGVATVYIDPVSGKLSNEDCPSNRMEAFLTGTEPTAYCTDKQANEIKKDPKKGTPKGKNSSWWNDLKRWWND